MSKNPLRAIFQKLLSSSQRSDATNALRNTVEFVVLFAIWGLLLLLIRNSRWDPIWLLGVLVSVSWAKTLFFGVENIQQLLVASHHNIPYYKFMMIMLVNMAQIVASFAFDYHCLHQIDPGCFAGINSNLQGFELVFEFFYYSVLTFTFFGYGDITPQTMAAKLLTMTEVLVAFTTVIFLLSDFISLKESVSQRD